jgi:23S rRNA (guanine745-N1)-methyltransferase
VHAEVVARLRCPVCYQGLSAPDATRGPLRCPLGHSFDQAKQGYAQLTARPLVHTGDTADMVAARVAFLGGGHYDPISDAIAGVARRRWSGGLIVDAGAGTGHHTVRVLAAVPDAYGLALDASKPCARLAARAHRRLDAVVCDVWQPLPVRDGVADLVLNVFAPRAGREFARSLSPGGALVSVTPRAEHLHELVGPLDLLHVDPAKPERINEELGEWFGESESQQLQWTMRLRHAEMAALVGMGPSAWHTNPAALAEAIAHLPEPMIVTASVRVAVYLRR